MWLVYQDLKGIKRAYVIRVKYWGIEITYIRVSIHYRIDTQIIEF